jgi:hypothetical protein
MPKPKIAISDIYYLIEGLVDVLADKGFISEEEYEKAVLARFEKANEQKRKINTTSSSG